MSQSQRDRSGDRTDVKPDRYRLLAAKRRRLVLEYLAEQPGPVELSELASAIATREHDLDASHEHVDVERVAITLHHVHLPMLSRFGILEYDASATRIESCPSRADARALAAL